ncbi:MAG: glycosyltransferase family 4 protein [Anaerolineae bacterium]|nr:glycosyltransferase family 4 protein [Anaerolineae bacterium]
MTKMRIGLLAPDLNATHGWGVYSLELIGALQRAGVSLTIVSAENSPPLDDFAIRPLLPSLSPFARGFLPRLLAAYPAARAALAGCDLVHALAEPYAPLGAWAAGSRPLVTTGHGTYVRMGQRAFPSGWLYRRAFERGLLICVSHYTETVARAALPGAQTAVVLNGVDAARYADIERQPAGDPTLLSVGAVKARKGILPLVQALALVRERIPRARLTIAGSLDAEPGYVAAVRHEIERLDLGDAVSLLGRVPEAALHDLYASAHVFALPSQNVSGKFEGYGLALIEASAAGLPVVGSLGCGAEDAVDDEVTGLLVPQGDVERLAVALARLLEDRELAARMGGAGRRKALAQTWDVAAAGYIAQYERLLGMVRS